MNQHGSFLHLLDLCDNFKIKSDGRIFATFYLSPEPDSPALGLLRLDVVSALQGDNERNRAKGVRESWHIDTRPDPNEKTRVSFASWVKTPADRTQLLASLCTFWHENGIFSDAIGGRAWRNEQYAIYANPFGPRDELTDQKNYAFSMERSACELFGVVTFGVHLTMYQEPQPTDPESRLMIWVPRRAKTKPTWGGYLDNTVAGGIPTGTLPLDAMVKECAEEASLPDATVRKLVKSVGSISYYFRNPRGGLQPEVQYAFDLLIPRGAEDLLTPRPFDGEVESFELLPVEEVISRMHAREFKPNCALVLINFLIRHGFITPENEENYLEIMTRLHGRLDYDLW